MPVELVVPSVGESITEVEIGDWLKSEGEHVDADEPIVVIETEKVTVELPSPASGTLKSLLKQKGEKATVGDVIGYLEEGEGVRPARRVEREPAKVSAEPPASPQPQAAAVVQAPQPSFETETKAPPKVESSHDRAEEIVPMTPIRRRIAERLVEAQKSAALLTTFNQIDMSAVMGLRKKHQEI